MSENMDRQSMMDNKSEVNPAERSKIPVSTSSKVIIPSNARSGTFYKSAYVPEFMEEALPREEFNEIMNQCSKLFFEAWKEHRNDEIETPASIKLISLIASLSLVGYIVMTVMGIFFKTGFTIFFFVGVFLLLGSTILFLYVGIANFRREMNKEKGFNELLKESMDDYFRHINPKLVHVRLNFIPVLNYIECHILKQADKEEEEKKNNANLLIKQKQEQKKKAQETKKDQGEEERKEEEPSIMLSKRKTKKGTGGERINTGNESKKSSVHQKTIKSDKKEN